MNKLVARVLPALIMCLTAIPAAHAQFLEGGNYDRCPGTANYSGYDVIRSAAHFGQSRGGFLQGFGGALSAFTAEFGIGSHNNGCAPITTSASDYAAAYGTPSLAGSYAFNYGVPSAKMYVTPIYGSINKPWY